MEKTAKRVLSAMLYTSSKHGVRFRYSVADDIFDEEVSEYTFGDGGVPNADHSLRAELKEGSDLSVQRNKALGLFDATVETMNFAGPNSVRFEVNVDGKIIHYTVDF